MRYRQLDSTNVDVFVEEEKSLDTEINHTTEVVGYIAFDHPGPIDTVGPPFAPTGLSLADGATITTSSVVTLSCNTVANAFAYEFEIWYSNGGTWSYYYTYSSNNNS